MDNTKPCTSCGGTGRTERRVWGTVMDAGKCKRCHGTGKLPS